MERFPDDFMFQLTEQEWDIMSSQIVMTLKSKRPKSALPFVFTEHGVTMLSSVLRSPTAIQVNIQIVRAFVAIRNLVLQKPIEKKDQNQIEMSELKLYLEEVFSDQNDINEDTRMQIELINQSLAELQSGKPHQLKPRRKIGYFRDEE